jgi:hypothetical protein
VYKKTIPSAIAITAAVCRTPSAPALHRKVANWYLTGASRASIDDDKNWVVEVPDWLTIHFEGKSIDNIVRRLSHWINSPEPGFECFHRRDIEKVVNKLFSLLLVIRSPQWSILPSLAVPHEMHGVQPLP